jgi:threonine aldolase
MDRIDFRSDTVSWPTPAMREAMANAPLGDDVYGEDPTVNALEARAAEMLGKDSAMFVASGTMGNLVSILSHATRGEEAIVGHDGHTFSSEAGGMAALGGIVPTTLPTDDFGRMDLLQLKSAIHPDNEHYPHTSLILVENSYGNKEAYPIPLEYFQEVRQLADQYGLSIHMDGARIFNAAVARNVPASDFAAQVDSVTFCLSKGLCSPVGSIVCGDEDFIYRARRNRKLVGGGMRQAGVLAAAGLVSLNEMVDRLAEDHRRACQLAEKLADIDCVLVDRDRSRTNMVFFEIDPALGVSSSDVVRYLREENGILLGGKDVYRMRAVLHYWIDDDAVDALAAGVAEFVQRAG